MSSPLVTDGGVGKMSIDVLCLPLIQVVLYNASNAIPSRLFPLVQTTELNHAGTTQYCLKIVN